MQEVSAISEKRPIEWWSFDAVSDDGEAFLSIRFFNRHLFSRSERDLVPTVSFVYFAAGRQVCRAVIEYPEDAMIIDGPELEVAGNRFGKQSADYGNGFDAEVSLPIRQGGSVDARLEWLSLEDDRSNPLLLREAGCGEWKIESPRSDVSGRITVTDRRGREDVHQFRGTGSHSHYQCASADDAGFGVRLSGSAHFADSTIFFCREAKLLTDDSRASLSLILDDEVIEAKAVSAEHYWTRTRYGIKYPRRFLLSADDLKLRVKLMPPYESELCFTRFPAEITLTTADEKPRKAIGCVEVLEPRRMRSNLVRWFSGLGVGRDENAPYL